MGEYRRDVKQYHPTGGTDIRDAIEHVIRKCSETDTAIELVHNDNHIVVLPNSSPLDIYSEWIRQHNNDRRLIDLGAQRSKE